VLIQEKEPNSGLEAECSDEAKELLAKVKVVIARNKSEAECKVKAPKQTTVKKWAEEIVHPVGRRRTIKI